MLIDAPCLLHRARHISATTEHPTGRLEFAGDSTGVVYGFLKQVKALQSRFQTRQVAFAFDGRGSKRQKVCKAYKANRKPKPRSCDSCSFNGNDPITQCKVCYQSDCQDAEAYGVFKEQCRALREEHLPALGHRNVFVEDGYEADDVLASLVKHSLREDDEAVIVSSDHDLYQLLSDRVSMWLPHKKELYRQIDFMDQYGIPPEMWPSAMAISGCPGDGVAGVKGIGLKFTCRFLRGELKPTSIAHKAISAGFNAGVVEHNFPLVELPYPGCPVYRLRKDDCTAARWRAVCKQLGFDSLLGEL